MLVPQFHLTAIARLRLCERRQRWWWPLCGGGGSDARTAATEHACADLVELVNDFEKSNVAGVTCS